MIKYGFEREYFVVNQWDESFLWSHPDNLKGFQLCPDSLPRDECGYLAEARGLPDSNPITAAYLLLVEQRRIRRLAEKSGLLLILEDTVKLPRLLFREALRTYGKPGYSDQRHNMYGKDYSVNNSWNRAALHIHFSNTEEIKWRDKDGTDHSRISHLPLDMCKYIYALDKAFAKEIKEAKRLPGFYEMKPHGFEYRSLPTSVDPIRVAEVLEEIK